MQKGYLVVEGHGEVAAAGNLITRLWQESGRWEPWAEPTRAKDLHLRRGVELCVRRAREHDDVGALLILRDEDDECPRARGPEAATWVQSLSPSFPVAVVLLHREYEVLFLPCLDRMAGRPIPDGSGRERRGLLPGTRYTGDWEAHRGVKEWLTRHMPPGHSYKPALDQLPFTRMIDIPTLRAAEVPRFGTLERALAFLAANFGGSGVYPPPPA